MLLTAEPDKGTTTTSEPSSVLPPVSAVVSERPHGETAGVGRDHSVAVGREAVHALELADLRFTDVRQVWSFRPEPGAGSDRNRERPEPAVSVPTARGDSVGPDRDVIVAPQGLTSFTVTGLNFMNGVYFTSNDRDRERVP